MEKWQNNERSQWIWHGSEDEEARDRARKDAAQEGKAPTGQAQTERPKVSWMEDILIASPEFEWVTNLLKVNFYTRNAKLSHKKLPAYRDFITRASNGLIAYGKSSFFRYDSSFTLPGLDDDHNVWFNTLRDSQHRTADLPALEAIRKNLLPLASRKSADVEVEHEAACGLRLHHVLALP